MLVTRPCPDLGAITRSNLATCQLWPAPRGCLCSPQPVFAVAPSPAIGSRWPEPHHITLVQPSFPQGGVVGTQTHPHPHNPGLEYGIEAQLSSAMWLVHLADGRPGAGKGASSTGLVALCPGLGLITHQYPIY